MDILLNTGLHGVPINTPPSRLTGFEDRIAVRFSKTDSWRSNTTSQKNPKATFVRRD